MGRIVLVGQGIAGTMLSWFLLKKGTDVLVADEFSPGSSSHIAGGLLNPITGRRFVKTWMADAVFPLAEKTYRELEAILHTDIVRAMPIHKVLYSAEQTNDWSTRCGDTQYKPYLQNETLIDLDPKVFSAKQAFEINGGFWVNSVELLSKYRIWLLTQNRMLEGFFSWKDWAHQHPDDMIVFCNGYAHAHKSPFADLPFTPTKGEALLAEIPALNLNAVINGDVTILPTSTPHVYYVGATMHQHYEDDKPSEKGFTELTTALNRLLRVPYKVVKHVAAIRPAVKDRRPLLGFHHTLKNMAVFNGLGTKGYSLGPYLAQQFADTLTEQKSILPEVDVRRFYTSINK